MHHQILWQRKWREITTLLILSLSCVGWAQTTAFTYQGKLTDAGNPANGNFDLQFKLFDTVTVGAGTQQGATLVRNPVAVSAGIFTVHARFRCECVQRGQIASWKLACDRRVARMLTPLSHRASR